MKILRSHRRVAASLALTSVLVACGGGGGGGTSVLDDEQNTTGSDAQATTGTGSTTGQGTTGGGTTTGGTTGTTTSGTGTTGGDGTVTGASDTGGGTDTGGQSGGGSQGITVGEVTLDAGADVSALEGSVITLSAALSVGAAIEEQFTLDAEFWTVRLVSGRIVGYEPDEEDGGAGTPEIMREPASDPGSLLPENRNAEAITVRLPLVTENSVLEYRRSVRYRDGDPLTGDESGNDGLSDSVLVTVLDGAPSAATVITALRQPAVGAPAGVMRSIDEYEIGAAGTIAYTGTIAQSGTVIDGVWRGPRDAVELLIRSGGTLAGVPSNVSFDGATTLHQSDAGELAMLIDLAGAGDGVGAAVSDDGQVRVLLRNGDPAPDMEPGITVERLLRIRRTAGGAFVSARIDSNGNATAIWQWSGGELSLVARSDGDDQQSPRSADACVIRLNRNAATSFQVNEAGVLAYPVDYQLPLRVVNGLTLPDSLSGCQVRAGLARFTAGSFDFPVSSSDPIAGIAGTRIGSIGLLSVNADGDVIASISGSTPSLSRIETVQRFNAGAGGSTDLLVLAGETLPPAFVDTISALQLSSPQGDRFAGLALVPRGVSIVRSEPRSGVPYADLLAPGASAFSLVASTDGGGPDGSSDAAFFAELGPPAIDGNGAVYYYGVLGDSASPSVADAALWRTTAADTDVSLIGSGAIVQQGGDQVRIRDIDMRGFGANSRSVTGTPEFDLDAAGNVIFLQRLADGSASALLFVDAR